MRHNITETNLLMNKTMLNSTEKMKFSSRFLEKYPILNPIFKKALNIAL